MTSLQAASAPSDSERLQAGKGAIQIYSEATEAEQVDGRVKSTVRSLHWHRDTL